jgi:hypothetical protein
VRHFLGSLHEDLLVSTTALIADISLPWLTFLPSLEMFRCLLLLPLLPLLPILQMFNFHNTFQTIDTKAIPLQARTGPEGSRRLRLPDF